MLRDSVLRVRVGSEEVCAVRPNELPTEKRFVAALRSREDVIVFADSGGRERTWSMTTAFDDGDRFLHMSVRVSAACVVQIDGILTETSDMDPLEAYRDGARGLRFQPFFLPESEYNSAELAGHGLMFRGLHYPGVITVGNVSLMCVCDHCDGTFRLQSFHSGFGYETYFHCSSGPHTLVASIVGPDAAPGPGSVDSDAMRLFERKLPTCSECGGTFAYVNPLLCPHCHRPFVDFAAHPADREHEYYGHYLYGGVLQRYGA